MELSLTDHVATPLDFMSILPKIFNFEEGFIFNPEITSNLNTGARESRIDNSTTLSQLRSSPNNFLDLPLITTTNLFVVVTSGTKEEFTRTTT